MYEKIVNIPVNYGDLIVNFLSEDKTLNFLQSVWIIVAILAASRVVSRARRMQRRYERMHYEKKHWKDYQHHKKEEKYTWDDE